MGVLRPSVPSRLGAKEATLVFRVNINWHTVEVIASKGSKRMVRTTPSALGVILDEGHGWETKQIFFGLAKRPSSASLSMKDPYLQKPKNY